MDSSSSRLLVYLAGPYSDSPQLRVLEAADMVEWLYGRGYEVFSPHLSFHYLNLIYPHDYAFWMERCLAMVAKCDLLVRMPGVSSGSDRECEAAKEMGIPVLNGQEDVILWEVAHG